MFELKLNNEGSIEIFNSLAAQGCLTPPLFYSTGRYKMKKSSWKIFWNKFVLATGMLALIAVVSGAQVGPSPANDIATMTSPHKQHYISPYLFKNCSKNDFLGEVLSFQKRDTDCSSSVSNHFDQSCQSSACKMEIFSQRENKHYCYVQRNSEKLAEGSA